MITSKRQTKGRVVWKKMAFLEGKFIFFNFFEINEKKISFKQFTKLNAFLLRKILSKIYFKKIEIKWPNDLLIDQKKFIEFTRNNSS